MSPFQNNSPVLSWRCPVPRDQRSVERNSRDLGKTLPNRPRPGVSEQNQEAINRSIKRVRLYWQQCGGSLFSDFDRHLPPFSAKKRHSPPFLLFVTFSLFKCRPKNSCKNPISRFFTDIYRLL